MATTIKLNPGDEMNARRKLDRLGDMGAIFDKPMSKSLFRLQNKMAVYPPPPPNSRYVRTFRLQKGWTTANPSISGSKTKIVGKIGNNTEYGPLVQSAQFQHRVHRGRWQTDEGVLSKETDWIEKQFNDALSNEVR